MVVSALVQLAIAGPVGILFGLGYGTAIRVGYEQVYPALFGDKALPKNTETILKKLETFYTSVGGLEAHKFGINQGIKNALKAIDADPELVDLIKKNSSLDSQTITVNLSGSSVPTPSLEQSEPSSVEIPPGLGMSVLSYVKALADNLKKPDSVKYTELIERIGLSKLNTFKLVRDGHVSVQTGGFTVRIEFGMLTLATQKKYIVIHNAWNEQVQEQKGGGPSSLSGGLTGDKKPIGVKWTKAAGQSQRMEKQKLINIIRDLKAKINADPNGQLAPVYLKRLNGSQQQLVNLLARYRF